MAFKVGTVRTSSGDWYEISWFSPDIGLSIKGMWGRTSQSGYGPFEGTWELISADLK